MGRPAKNTSQEVDIYERQTRVLEMRRDGHTFQQIANTLGLHDRAAAFNDYKAALASIPTDHTERAVIRAESYDRLENLYRHQMKTINDPPYQHSAIGRLIALPDQPGEYLRNESARTQAVNSAAKLIKQEADLFGLDLAPEPDTGEMDAMVSYFTDTLARCRELEEENAVLRQQLDLYQGAVG